MKVLYPLLALIGLACSLEAASYKTEMVVAADGSGDYSTIQAAIDDSKSFPDLPLTITVREGVYHERVTVPAWNPRITMIGEGTVVVSAGEHFKTIDRGRNSTFMTATFEVLANDFVARNLRIENTAGPVGQAIALRVEGDRCAFIDCEILGNQDTLYVDGEGARQYFKNCRIEGTTDYIFGQATAFFENCELYSKANSYLTAASTAAGAKHGLVFVGCRLSAAAEVEGLRLGRPWRKHAKTVFVDCEVGEFIAAEGWGNWGLKDPGATVFYAESRSSLSATEAAGRVDWAHLLSDKEAKGFTKEAVLGAWAGGL